MSREAEKQHIVVFQSNLALRHFRYRGTDCGGVAFRLSKKDPGLWIFEVRVQRISRHSASNDCFNAFVLTCDHKRVRHTYVAQLLPTFEIRYPCRYRGRLT